MSAWQDCGTHRGDGPCDHAKPGALPIAKPGQWETHRSLKPASTMGADSVSRGAWRLPPSVGGRAKAAVDDYWARPLRCATGSDPSPFRPLPASRSARTGLIDLLPRWLVARMLPISA